MTQSLQSGFLRSAEHFPGQPAVAVAGTTLSYHDLRARAASLAATLLHWGPTDGPPLTAVFAYRSPTAFAGVLGALFRGHGYVPLNRTFPPARTRTMLMRSGCRAMIVDAESSTQLDEILKGVSEPLLVLLADQDDDAGLARRWPTHQFRTRREFEPPEDWQEPPAIPDSIAYLLFTSGSTGMPKGVMVSHRNVTHFIHTMVERYSITAEDRFSQNFDMTFDLSAFDMFVAWERGACVCCPSQKILLNPGRFIQESRLSVWFSVPSTTVFMKRFGMLKPGQYPGLRWSLFCGEPLPVEVAEAWSKAAPNSSLENLYGPTELTIACTAYRWNPNTSPAEAERGLVPIGEPLPGLEALIARESLQEADALEEGELLISGPQVSSGYWHEEDRTAAVFVVPPQKRSVYYRTGDLVRRVNPHGPMVYLGRTDQQIKVRGHRVELGEVEAHLRAEADTEMAIAVGWPVSLSGADGIVAFVDRPGLDLQHLRSRLKTRLPSYAVPRDIRFLSKLPLNANGKVDRKALVRLLEES